MPFAATGSGHAEGTKRLKKIQPTASSWGLSQSLSMDLQTLGPFLSRVLLGFIGVYFGALQKWIWEVDGANQLAAGFAQKLRGKRGRCLFLLWNLWGCIFGFHVHFLRVCMIFDLFFFTSRLQTFSAAQSTLRKNIFGFSERFVNKEPFGQELPSSKLTWQQKVDLE